MPTPDRPVLTPAAALAHLRQDALALGFVQVGVCDVTRAWPNGGRLHEFLALGRHGEMDWLARTPERRERPRGMWPEARSAIVLAMSYGPENDPLPALEDRGSGVISVYARNRDYHDLIKKKLKRLAGDFLARTGEGAVKVFVDTAPLLEKPLAARAGLGWQGKHTNLVSRQAGSWTFLASILTDLELPTDEAHPDRCGGCRRCLTICPTDAFPAPYQLDARRCISYLTIEHKGHIAREFRAAMGNRIYGCDDCLAVCPWNKFAKAAGDHRLVARDDLDAPPLAALAALDDGGFRQFFAGSPIKRIGRDRFLRNVLIAIGNSGDAALVPSAERLLDDPSPLVRAMAVWALARLLPPERLAALARTHTDRESDPEVRVEWRQAQKTAAAAVP